MKYREGGGFLTVVTYFVLAQLHQLVVANEATSYVNFWFNFEFKYLIFVIHEKSSLKRLYVSDMIVFDNAAEYTYNGL